MSQVRLEEKYRLAELTAMRNTTTEDNRVSRKLNFGDSDRNEAEDKTNDRIIEELRADQRKFEAKYNFDVTKEEPLPGRYKYKLENGTWVATLTEDERGKENECSSEEEVGLSQEEGNKTPEIGTNRKNPSIKKRDGEDNYDSENYENNSTVVPRRLF